MSFLTRKIGIDIKVDRAIRKNIFLWIVCRSEITLLIVLAVRLVITSTYKLRKLLRITNNSLSCHRNIIVTIFYHASFFVDFFINSCSVIPVTVNKSYEIAIVCQNYNFAFISLTNDVIIRCLLAKKNFR